MKVLCNVVWKKEWGVGTWGGRVRRKSWGGGLLVRLGINKKKFVSW